MKIGVVAKDFIFINAKKYKKGEMLMKKLLLCMVFALCAAASANAYAADATYDKDTGIANIPGETRTVKTVIITDEDPTQKTIADKNIYYMDQALQGSPLSAATGFAIKEDPPAGKYYMTLRYSDDTTDEFTFTIEPEAAADLEMTALDGTETVAENGNSFSTAFITDIPDPVKLSDYNNIKFSFTDSNNKTTCLGYPLDRLLSSEISLGDSVFLGVQINNIPIAYQGRVSVSLSNAPLNLEGGNSNE